MASRYWQNPTTGDWDPATSWNTDLLGAGASGAPVAGDDVFALRGAASMRLNQDTTGLTGASKLGNIQVSGGFRGAVGLTTSPLDADAALLRFGGVSGGYFSGAFTDVEVDFTIDSNFPLELSGSVSTRLLIQAGRTRLINGFSSAASEVIKGPDTVVFIDTGVTLTLTEIYNNAIVTTNSAPAQVVVGSGATLTVTEESSGDLSAAGNGLVIEAGGRVIYNGSGDIPLLRLKPQGTIDFSANPHNITVGATGAVLEEGTIIANTKGSTIMFDATGTSRVGGGPTVLRNTLSSLAGFF